MDFYLALGNKPTNKQTKTKTKIKNKQTNKQTKTKNLFYRRDQLIFSILENFFVLF